MSRKTAMRKIFGDVPHFGGGWPARLGLEVNRQQEHALPEVNFLDGGEKVVSSALVHCHTRKHDHNPVAMSRVSAKEQQCS